MVPLAAVRSRRRSSTRATGAVTGRILVAPWTESEKLYVWALILGVMTLRGPASRRRAAAVPRRVRRGADRRRVLVGRPFTDPLPDFLAESRGYLAAQASGVPAQWFGAFQQMDAMRQYYYNTWYMWVHPPLLFFCYGAFVVSFAATVLMIAAPQRRSRRRRTAGRASATCR